jgi:hypothetical protein
MVERAVSIDVRYHTRDGVLVAEHLSGLAARVFQHELDHLNGILYLDKLQAPAASSPVIGHQFAHVDEWHRRAEDDPDLAQYKHARIADEPRRV